MRVGSPVVVVVRIGVVSHTVAVVVVRFRRVERKGVIGVEATVVVVIGVRVVPQPVRVRIDALRRVGGERIQDVVDAVPVDVRVAEVARVIAIGVRLVGVGNEWAVVYPIDPAIVVVVGVGVVPGSVAIGVGGLTGVERERVVDVVDAVAIGVDQLTQSVSARDRRPRLA